MEKPARIRQISNLKTILTWIQIISQDHWNISNTSPELVALIKSTPTCQESIGSCKWTIKMDQEKSDT